MSLSVGYAYFSESIKATGTAKTLSYYTQPLKPATINGDTSSSAKFGPESTTLGNDVTYKSETHSHPYYYFYYDVPATSNVIEFYFYLYFHNYAKDINITDFTATFYDNSSVTSSYSNGSGDAIDYYDQNNGGSGTDAAGTNYYGWAWVAYIKNLKSGYFSTVGTRRQVYIRVSYKSQGTTRYMYFYYYFDIV
jgi:hypothetical protein